MNNVFEGLITYDLEGNLVPGNAATMPEVSDDGLTYTFTLREDANWSNGTPVTVEALIGVNVFEVFNDRFRGLLVLTSRTID